MVPESSGTYPNRVGAELKKEESCQDYCTPMCGLYPTQKHRRRCRLGAIYVFPVSQTLHLEEESFCELPT